MKLCKRPKCWGYTPGDASGRSGCRTCWNLGNKPEIWVAWWKGRDWPKPKINRHVRCLYLGKRLEFKPGCHGWHCRHECEKGHEAKPGGVCQSCPDYTEDLGPWLT